MRSEILPPLAATVHVKPTGWRFGLRLWLPLFLLWLPLLPLLVLALPFLFVATVIFGVRFWSFMRAALALLAAFHGTRVEIENPNTRIFINVH
jgi:hypothetical protein